MVRRTAVCEGCWGDGTRGNQRIKSFINIRRAARSIRRRPIYPHNHFRTPSFGGAPGGTGDNRGGTDSGSQKLFRWKGMQDYVSRSGSRGRPSAYCAVLTPSSGSSHYFLPLIRPENCSSGSPSHPCLALSSRQRPSPRSIQPYHTNLHTDRRSLVNR